MPFQKGQSGNPKGKPKGTKNAPRIKVADINAAVSARAHDLLEQGLGKAYDVVDEQLDAGNPQVAMWMIDRLVGKAHSMLPEAIEIKLNTMDNVMIAAQGICEMAMHRKLSVDDALKSLQMLSQYAQFRAFERVEELRELVEELRAQSEAKTIEGKATMPAWGRLSESSETANKTPAE